MLAHEKLHVYARVLEFVSISGGMLLGWDKRHAVVDQLRRASESLLLNLAESARFCPAPCKLRALDCAMGSCLECAAALDVATASGLAPSSECDLAKPRLHEIARMMIGLRKAWAAGGTHEDPVDYEPKSASRTSQPLFHHETLDVYVVGLKLVKWSSQSRLGADPSARLRSRIDECATSIVLNIAEGNGRYSELDHHRFLDLAETSAIKTAAYLDLAVQNYCLPQAEVAPGKVLLERIIAMLSRM